MLTKRQEIELVHRALFDPYDQSLWFYHQNLMCTFDPDRAAKSLAPRLSDSDRLEYICREMDFVLEILDDVTDCKWVYQTLIECRFVAAKISGSMSEPDREQTKVWLKTLKQLDQLRTGRWDDLEAKLEQ